MFYSLFWNMNLNMSLLIVLEKLVLTVVNFAYTMPEFIGVKFSMLRIQISLFGKSGQSRNVGFVQNASVANILWYSNMVMCVKTKLIIVI
jgi:hypothetical protein